MVITCGGERGESETSRFARTHKEPGGHPEIQSPQIVHKALSLCKQKRLSRKVRDGYIPCSLDSSSPSTIALSSPGRPSHPLNPTPLFSARPWRRTTRNTVLDTGHLNGTLRLNSFRAVHPIYEYCTCTSIHWNSPQYIGFLCGNSPIHQHLI